MERMFRYKGQRAADQGAMCILVCRFWESTLPSLCGQGQERILITTYARREFFAGPFC